MKGTFNQGWWNCFESFAAELLFESPNAQNICTNILVGAGITQKEARAWLDKPIERNPEIEKIVRNYYLNNIK